MNLAPGVRCVATTRRDNAFLLDGDDGYTLVDVGWASAPRRIEDELGSLGDIRRIVLTHAHPDHVKGAAELVARTGARLFIHEADAPWLAAGRVPSAGRSGVAGRLLDRIPLLHWAPVTADVLLRDGDRVEGAGGLRVIHTPGHTPGHIALHYAPGNTVLVGDAVFNRGAGLSTGPAALAADPAQRPSSLARLPRDVAAVGLAHGDALRGEDLARYHALLERMKTEPPVNGSP
ncbi:MBL fold metallo-hydrolase [Amycolatopsis sp. K13G38]|uniref:MBL fold metallo-hydrolase n=1 Tax=Amycolatopsis acididurans TaxID=2724524 RepID=A0ABX1IY89_9PSEU|nr:MBL fold metallo-hydrolase [Amycolatopsis acididurans]NKQ52483.1 MBL fold metallo-hydrolase [Amycolatopsis acididurans]